MRLKIFGAAIILLYTLLTDLQLYAQSPDAALLKRRNRFPDEKIYIQYDKSSYVAGETIWLKAFLYNDGKPSWLSNNFYLQVLGPSGNLVSFKKYPVKGATVSGSIELPDSLPQGNYTIRALTPHMLNTAPDFLYTRNFFLYNPSSKKDTPVAGITKPAIAVQFFPESGYLVDGILSTLAFKAVNSSGMPVSISGYIKMDDTVTIAPFNSFHDGMGKVQFKPQAGKKYIATIIYNGQTNFFPLPEVQPAGVNLKIENEKGGKVFVLSRSKRNKEDFEKLLLVAQTRNNIVYENEISFGTYTSVKGHLITDSLPSGILHFTVFNADGIPLAERITFVDNGEYRSQGTVEIEKKDLGAKGENVLTISFPESIQRSCAVAITAEQDNNDLSKNNIISSFLLTEDLKGYIHDPAWYFRPEQDTLTRQAMDNLMLTQGWSRFAWKKILTGEIPEDKVEDKYLITVTGYLKDSKTKEPVGEGQLRLFLETEDSVNQHYDVEVSKNGTFTIDSLLFRGATKFYYAYSGSEGEEKITDIFLEASPADQAVQSLPFDPLLNAADPEQHHLDDFIISKRFATGKSKLEEIKNLDPVVLKSSPGKRPIDVVNEEYTNGVFKSMGRVNFDNINQPENDRSLSVYDFIKRSVNHVMEQDNNFVNRKNFSLFEPISSDKDAVKQKSLDSLNSSPSAAAPLPPGSVRAVDMPDYREAGKKYIVAIFLNESPAYVGILKTIRMDEVALLKYYEPGFIGAGGTDGPGGAISVYTKKNVTPVSQFEKLDHVTFNGYSLVKEFYSPDYSDPLANKSAADNRTTLYWNPEIYTGPDSKPIQVRFFNNDFSKKISLVFEGFDTNGKLIHIEKTIE